MQFAQIESHIFRSYPVTIKKILFFLGSEMIEKPEKTDSIIRANLLKTFSRIAILSNKTHVRFIGVVCTDGEPYLQIIPGYDQKILIFAR
jgi:hypothetical protein